MKYSKAGVIGFSVVLVTLLLSLFVFSADPEAAPPVPSNKEQPPAVLQTPQTEPALFAQLENLMHKGPEEGATPEENMVKAKDFVNRLSGLCRDYIAKYPEGKNVLTVQAYQVQAGFYMANLTGDKAAAEAVVKDVEKLIAEHPGVPVVERLHATLATYFMETDQLDKAAEHILKFAQTTPDEQAARQAWLILYQIQVEQDNVPAAKGTLKTIMERYPKDREFAYAEKQLKRLDQIGKPLDLSFTSIDGKAIRSADYHGKVVLVDCWASWCPPCREEMPVLVKLYQDRNKDGFEMIGINLDDEKDKARMLDFAKAAGMTWPESFDGKGWDGEIATKLMIQDIPASYLLDRTGIVRSLDLRGERLAKKVDELLKEANNK